MGEFIPFIDLKRQYRNYQSEIEEAVLRVLRGGRYILGPEVEELEETLASFIGVRYAIGVSSGTDALLLILKALEIGPQHAVITTPFTFVATAEVIQRVKAKVLFADIDEETMNISPSSVAEVLDKAQKEGLWVRAVLPVSLYGLPADLITFEEFCTSHGLFLIEDACQSFGASLGGRRSGSLGTAAATSFFPAKPLGGYGDGGMVFTREKALAERIRILRVHGQTRRNWCVWGGINGRLDTLQAAALLVKFKYFEAELAKRQEVARRYREGLKDLPVKFQTVPQGYVSAYAQFTIRTEERDRLQQYLASRGVPTAVYYPFPLHLQPAFAQTGYKKGDFPVAEKVSREVLSLPMHPFLEPHEQDKIIEGLRSFFGRWV